MIVYFADRNLHILGQASTSLPKGLLIQEDDTIEELDSGVNSFSCKIAYTEGLRQMLSDACAVGNFILKGSGKAFKASEDSYDSLYTIIETEFDTESQTLSLYAEDAGLDLINKVSPAMTVTSKTCVQMLKLVVPSDWEIVTTGVPTTTKSHKWDGDNTATERINSIASLFGCEVYYSFVVERFQITGKRLHVVANRGSTVAVQQLRLNQDINQIVTTRSIANLVTAYQVTGDTPSNKSTPIDLKNYSYSYTDPKTGDKYVVDKATGQMRNTSAMARWASALDSDGLIVAQYTYNTTSKATLAGQARAELQKHCNEVINYEIDVVQLPEGTQLGDRINIIDEEGELYLEARLLRIETSVCANVQKVVIGEFLIKSSGISDKVQELATQFAETSQNRKFFTWIAYADNDQGDGIALDPAGKSFMGLLPNQEEDLLEVQQAVDAADQFKWAPYQGCSVYLESTEGTTFKNKVIATQINATVWRGNVKATNITELKSMLGTSAEIRWYELIDGNFVQITDSRIINSGFALAIDSTAYALNYKCEVIS